jgi:hypothetical protein
MVVEANWCMRPCTALWCFATGGRAEQSRAEQSRAEQSRAEQSRAEQVPCKVGGLDGLPLEPALGPYLFPVLTLLFCSRKALLAG